MRRSLAAALTLALLTLVSPAGAQGSADEHIAAGLASYWRLDFRAAERHFQAAVDADPQNAAAWYYLAYTTYKRAEPLRPDAPGKHKAAELFARAYAIDPALKPDWGRGTSAVRQR